MVSSFGIEIPTELREGLRALKPVHAMTAIQRGMEKGAAYIVGQITKERLTGKGPFPVGEHKLGVVTGRLRRSTHWSGHAKVQGTEATTSIGATVEYAKLHEFGFRGAVQVKAHTRKRTKTRKPLPTEPVQIEQHERVTKKGKKVTVKAHTRKRKANRKPIPTGPIQVGEHTRQMNIPERAPFRTGIKENMTMFAEAIADEVVDQLRRPDA